MAKKKKHNVSWWKKKVWDEVSEFVRLTEAIKATGDIKMLKCCTCDKLYPAFGVGCAQAGHFVPGRSNAILFDLRGIHGQCYNCNINLKGNWPNYLAYMLKNYGQPVIDELLLLAKIVRQFRIDELETMYAEFRQTNAAIRSQYGKEHNQDIAQRSRIATAENPV